MFATAAGAADITYPQTDPKVVMTIPDGWSVNYTDTGIELRSPEKNSVIIAKILKRDRATVNAWNLQVLHRMVEDGVTEDQPAPPKGPAINSAATKGTEPKPVESQPPKVATAATAAPLPAPPAAPAPAEPLPAEPLPERPPLFSMPSEMVKGGGPKPVDGQPTGVTPAGATGAPSAAPLPAEPILERPALFSMQAASAPAAMAPPPPKEEVATAPISQSGDNLPGSATTPLFALSASQAGTQGAAGEAVAPAAPSPPPGGQKVPLTINGLHFQVVQLFGAKFHDKPTDIQLALFVLPKNEFFAVEQQSLPEDNRAVAVMASVKPLKH